MPRRPFHLRAAASPHHSVGANIGLAPTQLSGLAPTELSLHICPTLYFSPNPLRAPLHICPALHFVCVATHLFRHFGDNYRHFGLHLAQHFCHYTLVSPYTFVSTCTHSTRPTLSSLHICCLTLLSLHICRALHLCPCTPMSLHIYSALYIGVQGHKCRARQMCRCTPMSLHIYSALYFCPYTFVV